MHHRVIAFSNFFRHFMNYLLYLREVFICIVSMLVLGGVLISQIEKLPLGQSIYFAFITGLSIGYGDISPETGWGQVVSVGIGMIGMIFVGMTVAVATRALAEATKDGIEQEKS